MSAFRFWGIILYRYLVNAISNVLSAVHTRSAQLNPHLDPSDDSNSSTALPTDGTPAVKVTGLHEVYNINRIRQSKVW